MRILYCGPNASDIAQATRHGDVAASRWAYSLLRALADQGHEIVALTHTHERIWPRGEKLWRSRDERYFPRDWPCIDVPYPAIYKLREAWLNWAYPLKARRILEASKFDAVLLYNCMDPYQVAVQHVARGARIPVFPVILDGDDPRKDVWAKLKADTLESAGVVFVSFWAKVKYPASKPTCHLDGGDEVWRGSAPEQSKTMRDQGKEFSFVHTGSLDYWRGLDFFEKVAEIVAMRNMPIRFLLCGRISEDARDRLLRHRSVELKGFVSDQELDKICRNAFGFVNVREPSVGDNILNYPSKLPRCLSYGKPVVSTWVDSFAPEYRDLLYANNTNTPDGFVDELKRVIQESPLALKTRYDLIRDWFVASRLWSVQASRLAAWMREVILEA